MESASKRPRIGSAPDSGTVIFNVRGRHFELLPELIYSKPDTLLAQLMQDIGTVASKPVFVDANPDRFEHIIDWYRYGEMFPPQGLPIAALLRDASFFLLPHEVVIGGERHKLLPRGSAKEGKEGVHVAGEIRDTYIASVLSKWHGFDDFFQARISEIRAAFDERSNSSDTAITDPNRLRTSSATELCDFRVRIPILESVRPVRWAWQDMHNLNRVCAFKYKLEESGFTCSFEPFTCSFEPLHAYRSLSVLLPRASGGRQASVQIDQPVEVFSICPYQGRLCPGSKYNFCLPGC